MPDAEDGDDDAIGGDDGVVVFDAVDWLLNVDGWSLGGEGRGGGKC